MQELKNYVNTATFRRRDVVFCGAPIAALNAYTFDLAGFVVVSVAGAGFDSVSEARHEHV